MKRLFLVGVLVLGAVSGPVARAGSDSICNGFAPLEPVCRKTITLTRDHEEGFLTSTTFSGLASYSVDGPSGAVQTSCTAYPGAVTCNDPGPWPFQKGETISIQISLTGAGDWSFILS